MLRDPPMEVWKMSMDGKLAEVVSKALSLGKPRRFKQSVDLVVVLKDVDLRSPEGRIREIVYLPKKPAKEAEVCVVAEGDMEVKARALAVPVINREDLQKLRGNRKQVKKLAKRCDWVLVMAPLMGLAGGILGPALGPRGKAPTPVPPNADIEALVNRFKSAVWVRTKNQPQIMVRVGTEDMRPEDIAENIKAIVSVIENKLGRQKISKIYVKKTMGPPVQLLL